MKLIPVIVLVTDETRERLAPVIEQLTAAMDNFPQDNTERLVMRLNGWTNEMIAWGLVLKAASLEELEVVTDAP